MDILETIAVIISYIIGFAIGHFLRSLKRRQEDEQKPGEVACCKCGKSYQPLNDPDYIPELNICRDCLWKIHYDMTFGLDQSDISYGD